MFDDIKKGSKLLIRAAIKGAVGFIVVPLGILVNEVKPKWESANISTKIFTGIFLLPIVIFLMLAAPWWEDFEIVN